MSGRKIECLQRMASYKISDRFYKVEIVEAVKFGVASSDRQCQDFVLCELPLSKTSRLHLDVPYVKY